MKHLVDTQSETLAHFLSLNAKRKAFRGISSNFDAFLETGEVVLVELLKDAC